MNSKDIKVKAVSEYLSDQSRPEAKQYVYTYTISITNQGDSPAQLISRHWFITDENQHIREVQGIGVVGEQPLIEPGESYTYSSGVVLETRSGLMNGTYTMQTPDGELFIAPIPTFALVHAHALH